MEHPKIKRGVMETLSFFLFKKTRKSFKKISLAKYLQYLKLQREEIKKRIAERREKNRERRGEDKYYNWENIYLCVCIYLCI